MRDVLTYRFAVLVAVVITVVADAKGYTVRPEMVELLKWAVVSFTAAGAYAEVQQNKLEEQRAERAERRNPPMRKDADYDFGG